LGTPSPPAQQGNTKRPFKKFGRVAVWMSPKGFSITISERRYWDNTIKDWKDATWERPSDLPELIVGLQKALEFTFGREVPSPDNDDPPPDEVGI